MRNLISLAAVASLGIGAVALTGCESNNQSNLPSDENGAYAGGNGAFGENPANPGEHSGQRFQNNVPATQPSQR